MKRSMIGYCCEVFSRWVCGLAMALDMVCISECRFVLVGDVRVTHIVLHSALTRTMQVHLNSIFHLELIGWHTERLRSVERRCPSETTRSEKAALTAGDVSFQDQEASR